MISKLSSLFAGHVEHGDMAHDVFLGLSRALSQVIVEQLDPFAVEVMLAFKPLPGDVGT